MAQKAIVMWSETIDEWGNLTVWTKPAGTAASYGDSIPGAPNVTVFLDLDDHSFVGLETDAPEHALLELDAIRAQPYPLFDLPQVGLRDLHPAELLAWGIKNLYRNRIVNDPEGWKWLEPDT